MWCRLILSAVAISCTFTREIIVHAHGQGTQHLVQIKDVICMLMLSGLQKEDLDANTLQKLGRHNVNIDDLNNEQLRQECLLDSYYLKNNNTENNVTIKDVTGEVRRVTDSNNTPTTTSTTNKPLKNDIDVGRNQSMPLVTNVENKTIAQNNANINIDNTLNFLGLLPLVTQQMPPVVIFNDILKKNNVTDNFHHLANVTKVEAVTNTDLRIEYNIGNQPDVQSVINFWTKLTHHTKTVVTQLPTTLAFPNNNTDKNVTTTKKVTSPNHEYVHSREMEYISRILAEYLASQTVATTTHKVPTKEVFANNVPKSHKDQLNLPSIDEKAPRLSSIQNTEYLNYPNNEIHKISHSTRDDSRLNTEFSNSVTDETKTIPFKVTDYSSNQLVPKIKEIPSSNTPRYNTKSSKSKTNKKYEIIELLDRLLQMKNEFRNGEQIPDNEFTSKIIQLLTNNNDEQRKSKVTNQFQDVENLDNDNLNKNDMMSNNKFKGTSVETEPYQSNKMINREFENMPHQKENKAQLSMYDQSNINKLKRIKSLTMDTSDDEPLQIFFKNKNRFKFRPPSINRPKLFNLMVPSKVYTKQNENSKATNNESKISHKNINKLQESEYVDVYNDHVKELNTQQTAATEKSERNKLFEIRNEEPFNEDPGIVKNNEQYPKILNNNQFNTIVAAALDQIKPIQETRNNFEQDKDQPKSINEKNLEPTQNIGLNIYDPQALSANIIKVIAEKVKEIVLKDIGTVVTTTTIRTTSSTTVPTTTTTPVTTTSAATTTTFTTSEKLPTPLQKEITEANQVIQKLMEMFKELKALKETAKSTRPMPPSTTTSTMKPPTILTYPQPAPSANPYLMYTSPIFKPIQVNSYVPQMGSVPNPRGMVQQYQALQYRQAMKDPSGALTIQTNADEIAPLAIQISKPLKQMYQHIVVTTKRSVDNLEKAKELESKKHIEDQFRSLIDARDHRGKLKPQSDLMEQIRFGENFNSQELKDHYNYRSKLIDREKQWHNREYNEKVGHNENTLPMSARFPENINYPSRLEDLRHPKSFNYPVGYNQPGFNQPVSHHNGISNSNRIKHQPRSHHADYDRKPRYEGTKFHEKLERIENWPGNAWKDLKTSSRDNSGDEISARHQRPLKKTQHKKRSRFDDTHFQNFLKSQQKVTDMLEKILANNSKVNGIHSVEIQ